MEKQQNFNIWSFETFCRTKQLTCLIINWKFTKHRMLLHCCICINFLSGEGIPVWGMVKLCGNKYFLVSKVNWTAWNIFLLHFYAHTLYQYNVLHRKEQISSFFNLLPTSFYGSIVKHFSYLFNYAEWAVWWENNFRLSFN